MNHLRQVKWALEITPELGWHIDCIILKLLAFITDNSIKALTSVGQMYCLINWLLGIGWLEEVLVFVHSGGFKTIVLLEKS